MVKESKSLTWFNENVVENQEDILMVSELAARVIEDKLRIGLTSKPHIPMIMYCKVIEACFEVIKEKSVKFDELKINLANRLEIGFSNIRDDDAEKQGNFGVHINHIPLSKPKHIDEDEDDNTIELCTKWNAVNVVSNPEIIRTISVKAKDLIETATGIKLQDAEMVMPIFCLTHDQLISYINIKLTESKDDSFELNIGGLFDIGISFDPESDDDVVIYYLTSVSSRLEPKNDAKALDQVTE